MGASSASWKPGQSGNPGGRTKQDYRIKELAKEKTKLALDTLAHICARGESETARVSAAEALLNRGWGKPTQTIDATVTHAFAVDMTDAELLNIAAGGSAGAVEAAISAEDDSSVH